jgi:peptidoglycan hydrolase-like protein with peptidoglycan-binding domain
VPRRSHTARGAHRGVFADALVNHRREVVGVVMAAAATLAIFVNALFLQSGPHPAPMFATRAPVRVLPSPAVAPTQTQIIADIQRELSRRGFYDGPADGLWGAKTDIAVRDFLQAAGLKIGTEAKDVLLRAISTSTVKAGTRGPAAAATSDPIAQLLAPSDRVLSIQRALADFGYGQVKPSGVYDPATRAAIETFQRDRRLPVTGVISDDVVRELVTVTGRPLE